jgi:PRTRC genetic system protein D
MIPNASPVILPAAGIDVGFFSTKYSKGRAADGVDILVDQIPSLAPRINGGLQSFSQDHERQGVLIEVEPGLFHYVGPDAHNTGKSLGTRAAISNFSEGSAYKALFLGALYFMARHHQVTTTLVIDRLVVGLPLNTVYTHSEALKIMTFGEHTLPHPSLPGAFIKVIVKDAIVVAQPQGALITHGIRKYGQPSDKSSLVLDMGGGTFDWYVSDGLMANHERCGAAPIGALACAMAVCSQIHPELKDVPSIVDRVDKALRTGAETVSITGATHKMAAHWPAVRGVLHDALVQMHNSVGTLRDIDSILLTGGGSKLLSKVIDDELPEFKHLIEMDLEPVYSNVRGFHVIAEAFID